MLPTVSGFYWVTMDIGIAIADCVCMIYVKDDEVKILSPHNPAYREDPSPEWNKNIIFPRWDKWDNNKHLAWSGPIQKPTDKDWIKP